MSTDPSPDDPTPHAGSAPPEPAPTGLREAKKARTRAGIARAALQLVAEEGLHGTTVEAIAARADVSPRTFFNYFDSKDEAVVHLGADRFRRLMLRLFDSAGTTDAAPSERAVAQPDAPNPVLRIRDVMLTFLSDSESDPDAAADDDLVLAALEHDPSLFGALHTSMTAVSAEFEAALTGYYAEESDREKARVGLSVALGLTQTAMQSTRAGHSGASVTELVTSYFHILNAAFADATPTVEGSATS